MRAYRVPTESIVVPEGLKVRSRRGFSTGILSFVRYTAPSPLEYAELIWMPTRVEAKGKVGWYVARMHVDDEHTLAAGREVWALPKTMARFEEKGEELYVETADGSRFTIRLRSFGPGIPSRGAIATLQAKEGRPVRFRATSRGKSHLGRLEVEKVEIGEPGWESFRHAKPMRAPCVFLRDFETTMHPPEML
jgi:hypothetical protein